MDSKLIVISGASGAGKTSLLSNLLEKTRDISFVTAVTTRPPRQSENGLSTAKKCISYQEFYALLMRGELCCINKVYGEYYAFKKEDIECALRCGKVVLEYLVSMIDDIKTLFPNSFCVYVYSVRYDMEEILTNRNNEMLRRSIDNRDYQYLLDHPDVVDYFFKNDYSEESHNKFVNLINSI